MLFHSLTNFEIYSRDNLHKVKDSVYIRNLNEYINIGTYWVAFYAQNYNAICFDSFSVEHIPIEIKNS